MKKATKTVRERRATIKRIEKTLDLLRYIIIFGIVGMLTFFVVWLGKAGS